MTRFVVHLFAALSLLLAFSLPALADDFADGNAAYDRGDYAEAIRLLQPVAEGGHSGAQNRVGYMYANGMGVAKDDVEGVRWYRLSAEQGNGFAQSNLGFMYDAGRGVPEDDVEAVRWYRLAAEKGNASAQGNLGVMYRHGWGVEQSDTEAVKYYRLAADQGNANAQRNLGYAYQQGTGLLQDYVEALKWYRKAAEQGNLNALNDMGVMYKNGWGVEKDDAESVRWYRLAADKGHPHAQNNLGRALVDGRAGKIDLDEAFRLFTLAAASSDKAAVETALKMIADLPESVKTGVTPKKPETTTTTTIDRPRPAKPVPNGPAKIIPSCGGADIPSVTTGQKRVALVIGMSAYQHVTPLPNPTCDAMAMAATLQKAGFEVVTGYDLDKSGLEGKARDFVRIAANADVALFFYAGHGLQVDGINYMVPVDAKVEEASALRFELLDMDSITAFMSGPDKVGIILLDACRDNPFAAKLKRSLSRSASVSTGLAAIRNEGGGLVIGFATAPGDVAADGIGEHSPFTTALLEMLPTAGEDFEIVMRQVKARVVQLTEDEPTPQRPWTNSDLTTAFVLIPAE